MVRKTTWKEVHITRSHEWRALESYLGRKGEFGKYTTVLERNAGSIETNMPWSLLRTWFSFTGVPMPRNVLTADKPSWELLGDE